MNHRTITISLPDTLWKRLQKALPYDTLRQKMKYGSFSQLVVLLLRKHLEQQEQSTEETTDNFFTFCGTCEHLLTSDSLHLFHLFKEVIMSVSEERIEQIIQELGTSQVDREKLRQLVQEIRMARPVATAAVEPVKKTRTSARKLSEEELRQLSMELDL